MKKIIKIGEKEVSIRGIKLKEIKEFAGAVEGHVGNIFSIIEAEHVVKNMYSFLLSQMDEVTVLLERFTDLKKAEIEELEITELTELGKELLEINGIDKESMESFFIKVVRTINNLVEPQKAEPAGKPTFVDMIPTVAG